MGPGIVIPLVILPIAVIGVFIWYRRSIARMQPSATKAVSGVRLTADALHRLASPPWRVVYEIDTALGGIDHVVVGPPGVIAITTVVADLPDARHVAETSAGATLVSEAAITRGPVDELLRAVAMPCRLSARIYWGVSDHRRQPFVRLADGSYLVEGQRGADWLAALADETGTGAATLDREQIDRAWRAILVGIGRPDPLP